MCNFAPMKPSLPLPAVASFRSAKIQLLATLLAGFLTGEVLSQNSVVATPLAETGGSAPGTAGTWSALSNARAAVAPDGGVGFQGFVGGVQGLWYGNRDSLDLVGLLGDPAPGTAVNYGSFTYDYSVTPVSGYGLGFVNRLSDNNDSIWSSPSGGSPVLLAMEGDAAPGIAENFSALYGPSVNNVGTTLFRAYLSNFTHSLWRSPAAGPPVLIARTGEATNLATIPGSLYSIMGLGYTLNDNDTAVFYTSLTGPGILASNNEVLLTLPDPAPVSPTLVARKGDVAPGTGGLTFGAFSACHINDSDDVIFRAALVGGAATLDTGVWLYDDALASISPVALEGEAAPGLVGAFFNTFEELFLANNGVIAVVATVRDAGATNLGRGVWIDAGAGLELVAQDGQNAFKKDGVTVHGVITDIWQVTMNMDGDLALEMTAGGVKGIWQREAVAAATTKQLLVVGDKIYDANRQVRTPNIIDLPETESFTSEGGGPLGRARSLGDDDVPLVWLNFPTGSGLYFVDLEPLSILVTSRNEQAPGTMASTLIDSIRPAGTINNNALVAFRAHLQNGTGDAVTGANTEGIWAEQSVGGVPQLTLVARQGDPAPGGDTYGSLLVNPVYNDNNSIAFPALLDGGGAAFFAGPIGSLAKVIKSGDSVNLTGIPSGAVYNLVRSVFAYNNGGRLVAGSSFVLNSSLGITAANDSAILRHGIGAKVIAREGTSVGAGLGVFDDLYNRPVLINSTNRVAFIANRKYNAALGITHANWSGVWFHNDTALMRVALGGTTSSPQLAPSAGGAQYLKPTHLVFNDADRIGFRTTLQGSGVTPAVNDVALYLSNAGVTPVLLARTGSTQLSGFGPAGIDDAATFLTLGRPDIDASTKLVFRGPLTVGVGGVTASDDDAIWLNSAGTTSLLLREGGFAPDSSGAPTTDVFESFDDPVIGTGGRVVVVARMRVGVGSIVGTNDRALFVQGSNGQFYRVAQKGQFVEVADGFGGTVPQQILKIENSSSGGGAGNSYKGITSNGFVLAYVTFGNNATAAMIFVAP